MPYTVDWENDEKTIVYYRFYDDWTPDELLEAFTAGNRLKDSVDYEVDAIAHFVSHKIAPPKLLQLALRMEPLVNHNAARTIVVGADPFIRSIHKVLCRIGNKLALKVSFEDTLEDAHISLSTTSVSQ
jgi:hypothetical protein